MDAVVKIKIIYLEVFKQDSISAIRQGLIVMLRIEAVLVYGQLFKQMIYGVLQFDLVEFQGWKTGMKPELWIDLY